MGTHVWYSSKMLNLWLNMLSCIFLLFGHITFKNSCFLEWLGRVFLFLLPTGKVYTDPSSTSWSSRYLKIEKLLLLALQPSREGITHFFTVFSAIAFRFDMSGCFSSLSVFLKIYQLTDAEDDESFRNTVLHSLARL